MPVVAIIKTDAGYDVIYPFQLKDAFKAAFPSARWDKQRRVWTAGPRMRKRLEQWAQEINSTNTLAAIAALEEADLNEREINALHQELRAIEAAAGSAETRLERVQANRIKLEGLVASLDAAKTALASAEAAVAAEIEAENAAKAAINAFLDRFVDRRLIEQRASEMERMKNDYRKKALYLSAQAELVQQRSRLAQAGKGWRWLDWLVGANFNRPDRDAPYMCPPEARYTLYDLS